MRQALSPGFTPIKIRNMTVPMDALGDKLVVYIG